MNLEKTMLKINTTLFAIFLLSFTSEMPQACMAPINTNPIGGRVKYYNPLCKLPVPHTNYSTIQPAPGRGTGLWNDIPGRTLHYNYGPVSHPGQPVLGMGSYQYMPCMTPCHGGACEIGPGGMNVKYSGTGVAGAGATSASGGGCMLKVGAVLGGGAYLYSKIKKKD